MALTEAPENVGENHNISFEVQLAGHIDMFSYFSGVFVCNRWFLLTVRVNVVSCLSHSLACGNILLNDTL